jgi:hypothetical protein
LKIKMEIILSIFVFLMVLALFLGYQLKHIRVLVEGSERKNIRIEKIEQYNQNLNQLLILHASNRIGIAGIMAAEIKKNIVLFGYNASARFIISEMMKDGKSVKYVIENNKPLRHRINKIVSGFRLISSEEVNELLTPDDELVVCILHDGANAVARELENKLDSRIKIHLLECLLEKAKKPSHFLH